MNAKEAKVEIKSAEDFDKFRATLEDRNIIREYNFILSCPLVIAGDGDVAFIECTFAPACTPLDIRTSLRITLDTESVVKFTGCRLDGPATFIELSDTRVGHVELTVLGKPFDVSARCVNSTWELELSGKYDKVEVFNVYSIHLAGLEAEKVRIEHARYVEICETRSVCATRFDMCDIGNLAFKIANIPNSILDISDTVMQCMMLSNSRLHLVRLKNCCVKDLGAIDSYVDLLVASSSACHSYVRSGSYIPSAMTNSSGFPDKDELVLYKAVRLAKWPLMRGGQHIPAMLKLVVEPGTKKHMDGQSGKVRVERAIPVELYDATGTTCIRKPRFRSIRSLYDILYKYRLGKPAVPTEPFSDDEMECAPGIHGFLSIWEAKEYLG